jgi:hypothetical protein
MSVILILVCRLWILQRLTDTKNERAALRFLGDGPEDINIVRAALCPY